MADVVDEPARRDARTVETTLAVGLGVLSFLALALTGWAIDRVLRALFGVSLAPAVHELLMVAVVLAVGVTVAWLVRARRRGL